MIWTLPNILSILRLLAAPGIALAFLFLARPYADWVAMGLFVAASITDYVDGYLARAWNQMTRFGAMIDPIADKAIVVTAIMVLAMNFGPTPLVVFPAAFILLRETFVSGLREFLGSTAGLLKVTRLAKWKTTTQMVAIVTLLSYGLFSHYTGMGSFGMDGVTVDAILAGEIEDPTGLAWKYRGMVWSWGGGIALLWLSAVLTIVTGVDYLRKAMPYLKETRDA